MTTSPCKTCADRAIGCHGLCKDYNEWVLLHAKEREGERKAMPRKIKSSDFSGTSPRPGVHRKTRGTKR